MFEKRIVFFDIETTGLYCKKGDKIIEIGCISYEGDEISKFHKLINPGKPISVEAFQIHRISDNDVLTSPNFSEVAENFLDFIKKDTLCGHNAIKFDLPFINYELKEIKMPKIRNKIIDTTILFKERFYEKNFKLDHMCQKFGIDLEEREENGHNAMLDVELLVKCYKKLMDVEVLPLFQ